MQFVSHYQSPIGPVTLVAEGDALVGAWFNDQRFFCSTLTPSAVAGVTPVLNDAARWLDDYFKGMRPEYLPALSFAGSDFRLRVWRLLVEIPYGQTTTYRDLGEKVAQNAGKRRMSAQAVGGAVGHNPICIFVPCHRVLAANGSLAGYAGGLERKEFLLRLEGINIKRVYCR